MSISFDNTENAFDYKPTRELKRAQLLFSSMSYQWLIKAGTWLTPLAIKSGLPINGLIRNTIFKQFVGGETLEETDVVAKRLDKYGVQVILDYGVEGKEGEKNFDHSAEQFIRVVDYASTQPNMPFISIKVTGFARFSLLEKMNEAASSRHGYEGIIPDQIFTEAEKDEWKRVVLRMEKIIENAAKKNVGVLIDAEESWIQDPVDALTMLMMEKFNKTKVVVYNTIQLYRVDRLQFLKDSFQQSEKKNFLLGAKLVRGAYMEKERAKAVAKNYPSPIQENKVSTDSDYNSSIDFCIGHINKISTIVASHNEFSNLYAVQLLLKNQLPLNHPNIHFSQLYGMSDNITFNLAKEACSVSKYLPFGPIKEVIPYLMRRAQENSSVKGQTGRELALIKKELKRRKINNVKY